MTTTRLLIVDDIPQVREDLRTLLTLASDIEVVGLAADGSDAIRQASASRPEVVLMDLEMPTLDGYEATRQIKSQNPACRVIALTIHDYREAREKAAQAGVDAYIVKGAPLETLVQAISAKKE
jgi:two-component system, NarL family, response regulator LiaR